MCTFRKLNKLQDKKQRLKQTHISKDTKSQRQEENLESSKGKITWHLH